MIPEDKLDLIVQMLNQQQKNHEDQKSEFREFKHEVSKRFERNEKDTDSIKSDINELRRLVMDIWQTRKEVEYKVTRDFIIKNIGWNLLVISIGLILGKMILL